MFAKLVSTSFTICGSSDMSRGDGARPKKKRGEEGGKKKGRKKGGLLPLFPFASVPDLRNTISPFRKGRGGGKKEKGEEGRREKEEVEPLKLSLTSRRIEPRSPFVDE